MKDTTPKTIHLKDYKKPDFTITKTDLDFKIYEEYTVVTGTLTIEAVFPESEPNCPLVLNGENIDLKSVSLDGISLTPDKFTVSDSFLTIPNVGRSFVLETVGHIKPQENSALEGFYQSGDIFCTQNEPEGFRKITYYLDRSDVMSAFITTISADKARFPYLLANGNKIDSGDLADGRHFAKWEDPFKKPCYLFALVAGNLGMVEDQFITMSGREISLQIFVDKGNEGRCDHAMKSLKEAMKWDEDTFGLEYDLDLYMIVAVDSFNFGAMENKGLNIFNSSCILADSATATDSNFMSIQGIVAHEYFHNWTGNRVTCRDWFQLTLKEGLTVYRDQEFSSDLNSRAVERIHNVMSLRERQFVEDAGPMAHPIKPPSYIQINNFYTSTVYQKGSEVIRMIATFIGKKKFRKGIDIYFQRHDGNAVTTEDFVAAMESSSGMDLTEFKNWYNQAGTPICSVSSDYDSKEQTYTLKVSQTCPQTKECQTKKAFHFPLTVGLLDKSGKEIELYLEGKNAGKEIILHITEKDESFIFSNLKEEPLPSMNRDFSAPIKLEYNYSIENLIFLLKHDKDPFNRFESGQRLANIILEQLINNLQTNTEMSIDDNILNAYGNILEDSCLDHSFKSLALFIPSENSLIEKMDICDFEAAHNAREFYKQSIALKHEDLFIKLYKDLSTSGEFIINQEEIGKRSLKNTCLAYLSLLGDKHINLCMEQFKSATNMTDSISALGLLCNTDSPDRKRALNQFHTQWQDNFLVMNKWFGVQSCSKLKNSLDIVKDLEKHPLFDIKNPNRVRVLLGGFASNNMAFHQKNGAGYEYMTDKIIQLNEINPSMAAGLAGIFRKYAKLDANRKTLMKQHMDRILSLKNLSDGVFEIVSKTIESDTTHI